MATSSGLIKNYIFVALLAITSFLGSLFILFPLFPFIFINRPVWRRVVDQIIGLWLCLPVALMEYFHGIRFRVTGDRMNSAEKAVIIMNHRTRLDWMFLWSALYRMDGWLLTTEKIILKAQLRKILGAGWAMECDNFIFLERSLEKDAAVLTTSARYLSLTGNAYQILIFPEGTDLCPNTLVKSDSYAESKNLPLYRHVLHPKTNGLAHLLAELKRNNGVDYIYDFTIAYPKEIVQTEIDFAKTGECPTRVDFHCRRHRVDDILYGPDGSGDGSNECEFRLRRWCEQLWQRKELALSRYYGSNNNNNKEECEGLSLDEVLDDGAIGDLKKNSGTYETNALGKAVLALALIYWLTSVMFWLYTLWAFWWLKYFATLGVISFKAIEYKYLGIERFEIALWKRDLKSVE